MHSILITGGSGTFANAFVAHLLANTDVERICLYSRGEHAQAAMRERFSNSDRLRFFIGDVRDKERLIRAMRGVDAVVHAAALKRIEVGHYAPDEMVKTNVLGTLNVVEAALDVGVPKTLLISSDKAWNPVSPYGYSKAMAEALILNANHINPSLMFAAVRYGNVWDSQGSVVPRWRDLIASGCTRVPVTDPNCTRFMMLRQEAVELVWGALLTMQGGELRIPDWLPAYRLGDLAVAMGVDMAISTLPAWEKRHEGMRDGITSDLVRRLTISELQELLFSTEV